MTRSLLVVEAYDRSGRDEIAAHGASVASQLYRTLLMRLAPGIAVDIVYPADTGEELPSGADLTAYAGIVWTGSSLTVYHDDPRVTRQIDFARAAFAAGVPQFGSCWAVQIAAMAAGGTCRRNPKGREFGVARTVRLNQAGLSHPLYTDKPAVFDALCSHLDEIERLPDGAVLLASNDQSDVQAAEIRLGEGTFWGVQYHPEFDLKEIAALTRARAEALHTDGFFATQAHAHDHAEHLEDLHAAPGRKDLAWRFGLGADVLDEEVRTREIRNWLAHQAGVGSV